MRILFLLVFYSLIVAPSLMSRAPQRFEDSFLPVVPQTPTTPCHQKEAAPTASKNTSSLPHFLVKIISPKSANSTPLAQRRSVPVQPAQTAVLPNEAAKIKPAPNESRLPFVRKNIEQTKKKVTRLRDQLELQIRRTQLSDAELYAAFKSGKLATSGSATGITTSEYLYCEDHVIVIKQQKGCEPEFFDVSDEFIFEPDTTQDRYNLIVVKTTDTDEELLLDCQTPEPFAHQIITPNKRTWYGKQTYTVTDGETVQLPAINFPGQIFLRDSQFLTIAVDDNGYCCLKPMGAHEVWQQGYTIVYR